MKRSTHPPPSERDDLNVIEPCRRCGSRTIQILDTLPSPIERRTRTYVACGKCGASGLPANTLEGAIRSWNADATQT